MIKATLLSAVLSMFLSLPSMAQVVAPITVHNTGVDSADVLVAPGAQASFWSLSARPAGAVQELGSNPYRYNCCYFPDTATAAWVSPDGSGGGGAGAAGAYVYDLVIDLTGLDPATASITGTFGTDNSGAVWLNGDAPVATTGSGDFGAPTPFTINSGFVAGLNTIHLQVNNEGDPTAFFLSFTSATANALAEPHVPVPAVPLPALAGLALLLLLLGSGSLLRRTMRH